MLGPAPPQQGAAEDPPQRPQSEITDVDTDDARKNAAGQADFAALDQQPGRDARRVLRDKRSEHDRERGQHGGSSTRCVARQGISDSYSSVMPRSVTSTAVRLTVAASSRSISTLMSRLSIH